jgi:hypothetical protein
MRQHSLTKKSIVMKKLVMGITAALLLFSASSFATNGKEEKTNAKVAASFKKEFSFAKDVNWQKNNNVYFASFIMGSNKAEAAYSEEGELLAISRQVELSQLPLSLSVAIAQKYEGYTLANNAVEITYNNETNYYLTIANAKNVLKLKCAASGEIAVESKIKRQG